METFLKLILDPLNDVIVKFTQFAPNLLAMLIIILAGFLGARVGRIVLVKLLTTIKFDNWSDRMGLTSVMRKGDLWAKPSTILGGFTFWLIFTVGIMVGLNALKIPAIEHFVDQFFVYLPRAFSGLLILVFGYLVAGFVGRAVLIAAVNNGYYYTRFLAKTVRLLLTVLIIAMALEQLQIAPKVVTAAFSIIFGGVAVALAIAFGVGGIGTARRMIEKMAEESDAKKQDVEHM